MEEAVTRVAEAVLGPDPDRAATNRLVLHADGLTPGTLLEAGRALSLFGGARLVLVRGLVSLPARAAEDLRTSMDRARAEPGGWPDPDATVVLVAGGADRKAPALRLADEAERVEIRPPAGRAMVGWLRDRARAGGISVTAGAAQLLVELVGEEPAVLAGELEKAALCAGPGHPVTEDLVRSLTGASRTPRYWELTAALEQAEAGPALACLEALLLDGEEAPAIVAWLGGHARGLARALAAAAEGMDARRLAAALRPPRPEFVAARLLGRATALGPRGVEAALARCFDTERRLKSGGGEPRALLTALVGDLAR